MVFAAIPGATLLPTDITFVKVVRFPVPDVLTCPKYGLSDLNRLVAGHRRAVTVEQCGLALSSIKRLAANGWL